MIVVAKSHETGIYTSALMAWIDSDYPLVLFKTNIGHAGEWLDEVLKHRPVELPAPLMNGTGVMRGVSSMPLGIYPRSAG